jgi:hypothetical protein
MTGLLTALGGNGMTPAVAAAVTILVRLATLWFAVLLGGVALLALRWLPVHPKGRFEVERFGKSLKLVGILFTADNNTFLQSKGCCLVDGLGLDEGGG